MTLLVLGGLCLLAAAILFTTGTKTGYGLFKAGGFGAVLVGLVLAGLSFTTTVPAQNSGVVTRFNRPTGRVLDAGFHWKSPADKVHDMDGTIQQIDNEGADGRTTVRLNNNSVMFVENNLRWRIDPAAAPRLYVDWKGFDNIQPGLVEKELKAALNVVLANYDALDPGKKGQTNDELAQQVEDRLNTRIGTKATHPEVEIVAFTIQRIDFDNDTQKRLNSYNEQVAKTRTAEEGEKTAAAEARQNKTLSGSVSNDPNVLVSKCLDILRQMSDKGQAVPPAFSCWPGEKQSTTVQIPTK